MNPEMQTSVSPEISRSIETIEVEPTSEKDNSRIPFETLQADLQVNYTDHLKSIENASLGILDGVVKSARIGFLTSLVLNVLSFVLGLAVIVAGLVILITSPQTFERLVGVGFSLIGLLLVITLLFWRGPLDRILESVSNLARINVITIGLAHRLNQISRVFVQQSLQGKMTIHSLGKLNEMIDGAVHNSVNEFEVVLPRKEAEEQVQEILSSLSDSPD